MTHLLGVLTKKDLISKLGPVVERTHRKIRKSESDWYYWHDGFVAWTNQKKKLDFKSAYPHNGSFYSPLHRKDITEVITTWGCAPIDKSNLIEKVKDLTPKQIEDLRLLPCSILGKMAVANKGDFSNEARSKFGRQDIVRKTESGCEIAQWIKERYEGKERKLIDEIKRKGLENLLSWVKTSFSVLIGSPKNLVAHNSGVELYYFENDEIGIVSSVKSGVKNAVKELEFPEKEIKKLKKNETKIFSRAYQ